MLLPAATQAEILRLHYAERWSRSRIARHLGLNRKSVRKVVARRSVALTPAPPRPRATLLTPFHARIAALLARDPERSAVNLLQPLRAEGYRGGITALRGHLARTRPTPRREAFLTLHFAPAEAFQVDWGEFGDVFPLGRPVHAFVMVACYSRLLTVEFTFAQTLEAFLRCHEGPLAFYGGCGHECWYDNLATAVAERRGRLVRFHPRFLAYAGHYGFRPVACTPGRANEKGRVEDAIKVPPGQLLARAHLPRPRRLERPGPRLARHGRQPARACGHPPGPRPALPRGTAPPAAAARALRHRRGAEHRGAAHLPPRLRREPGPRSPGGWSGRPSRSGPTPRP